MAQERFTASSFGIRWLLALILVLATFNPTPFNYVAWVLDTTAGSLPLKVLGGVVLTILYVIFLRATWRSIGPIGVVLALAFFGALIWALVDLGILAITNPGVLTWIALLVVATIMAIGLSWSHIRRRIAGQADVDDVDA